MGNLEFTSIRLLTSFSDEGIIFVLSPEKKTDVRQLRRYLLLGKFSVAVGDSK